MATFPNVAAVLIILNLLISGNPTAAAWCVAKTNATDDALQKALDYACGAGADCAPLQVSGVCFLPNTVRAHASYAFNSYYMHSSMNPVACDFAGTAAISKTDPSYGKCVYPASPSTAGRKQNTTLTPAMPPQQNGAPLNGSGGALTPPLAGMSGTTPISGGALAPDGMTPVPALDNSAPSGAFIGFPISRFLVMGMMFMVFCLMFQPMDIFVACLTKK